ncbi:HAMP domain-containing histidine kinase [Clostridium botulinum]|uniref:histidine kinase n=1 Tax=Clostridium botulinum TaxID=1491 RepID=A0A6B4JJV6_CLOBO|nr:HAMP domain-containing sensor histidine kinase [Clostridium botulinum]EES51313.1 histidine kinase [Clostridium botulinum E1 str. 'BoNT E Beluga']MBY6760150.1 HAMP domain-containing histidine kinase [Clostridium botulinum]MBY6919059.1 HAMP domain-containing histidine kinase [Clostridium botulinum]MCR1132218.1 HAMP domain-containing histidine kinase [Clostridium botulinum]NFH70561.1 HAMP domain-containing histidine kinase [Clostridium botulinum]
MIDFKKVRINLIWGIIIGFFLSQVIVAEGYAILVSRQQINNWDSLSIEGIAGFKILAFIVFIATIAIFNTKKFRKLNLNKISIYLILVVIIAVVVAAQAVLIIISIIFKRHPNIQEYVAKDYFVSINIFYIISFLGIAVFLITFVSLVNRKVKYIKFLTKEVKVIKDEGFGKTIKVKGKDELSELCQSINDMSLELRKKIDNEKIIEKNKNELITSVSHDLRTPLTSIIGYVDLLKKNEFNDKEKFDNYIEIIDERTKSLNRLINELFEYTKLTSHDIKLNYSRLEIVSLIEQMVGEYTPIFNKENLEVVKDITDKDIFINADIEKIVRVLENLLTNAIKYSVKNSKVLIKLFEENNYVVVSVSNKAKDITEDDLKNIFERFYKVDKSRKEQDSTGLGLSIVKRIVELHNGEIDVNLNEDIIEFKISLPLE